MAVKTAMIRTDSETVDRLRWLAGDMPVSKYLREVVSKPGGKAPIDPLEALRASILKRLDGIDALLQRLDGIETALKRLDTNLQAVSQGLFNEQNNNDILFDLLEKSNPGLKEKRMEIDASYREREMMRDEFEA